MFTKFDRSESEQLTIWTLLERVSAAPLDANIIDLSNWIGSLDLESAGDALVTWGISYRDRAFELLDDWHSKPPLTPAELIEPPFDISMFDDLVVRRMEWDLGDLVETIEADYPTDRQAAPKIAPVSKDAALELADLQTALDTAHDENIEEWVQITLDLVNGERSFSSLSRGRSRVQIWLSILLSEGKLIAVRNSGDFYDSKGIMVSKIQHLAS